jgi:hypothetical protein
VEPGSSDEIATGRAFNAWPCLFLVTDFTRHQNLSLHEPEAEARAEAGEKVREGVREREGEVVEGGQMSEALSLSLAIYLEPKLLERAKVRLIVSEARDDAGEDLLRERPNGVPEAPVVSTNTVLGGGSLRHIINLKPRQARGSKLAVLRGVAHIRYPMQVQEREITDFNGPQSFALSAFGMPLSAQFELPQIQDGQLRFKTSVTLNSEQGGRVLQKGVQERIRGGWHEGLLGGYLLPDPTSYSFTDTQGRIWRGRGGGGGASLQGPNGQPVPVTSPPQPPPDNFVYTEERESSLYLVPPESPAPLASSGPRVTINPSVLNRTGGGTYISQNPGPSVSQVSPEELAQVKFTKATFTTEAEWRTLEVPFEFRDLPLPPR